MSNSRVGAITVDRVSSRDRNRYREQVTRDSVSLNEWQRRIGFALKNLGDRTTLNRSPLAKLSYIERLAIEQFSGHLLPRGLALHDTLVSCVQKVSVELGSERGLARACMYLELLVQGLSCQEISNRLGLSREHVSRVYRKKALELVTEKFLLTVKNTV